MRNPVKNNDNQKAKKDKSTKVVNCKKVKITHKLSVIKFKIQNFLFII